MATVICSSFLLGCLAFLSWCSIVRNFVYYIFGWILCMCVYCTYDWEYLGGALFPFCPVRQHDYFCLTYINDCYSPPHTLALIPFTFLLPQVLTCTQSHWTNVHNESCEIKGFSTIKLQLSTSSRFSSIFFALVTLHSSLIYAGVMWSFLFLVETRILSFSAVWGISGAAG